MSFGIGAIGSLVSGLAGIGVKLGTEIPQLRKKKKEDASADAARTAATAVHNAALGASQSGHGASRGLALRAGLRSATDAAKASSTAGAAADMDQRRYDQQESERLARIANLGAGIAEGMGQMAQSFVTPKGGGDVGSTGAALMQKNANSPEAMEQAKTTLPGADTPEAGSLQAPDTDQLASSVQGIMQKNEEMADLPQDDPGGAPNWASRERLEQLRVKSPLVAAPQIEEELDFRLRAKKLMLQDAERLGLPLDSLLPMINRRFGLKPGQSVQNPLGLSLDYNEDGDK